MGLLAAVLPDSGLNVKPSQHKNLPQHKPRRKTPAIEGHSYSLPHSRQHDMPVMQEGSQGSHVLPACGAERRDTAAPHKSRHICSAAAGPDSAALLTQCRHSVCSRCSQKRRRKSPAWTWPQTAHWPAATVHAGRSGPAPSSDNTAAAAQGQSDGVSDRVSAGWCMCKP